MGQEINRFFDVLRTARGMADINPMKRETETRISVFFRPSR
jgi:hypothetical protein